MSTDLPGRSRKGSRKAARNAVLAPAVALISVAGLWILLLLGAMAFSGFLIESGTAARMRQPSIMSKEAVISVRMMLSGVLVLVNIVVLLAGIAMLRLRHPTFAKVGAMLPVVPCLSPGYLLGIPIGIWALMVLNRPEVKQAFR